MTPRARGFTLVELVTILVVIGVLAVVALPRMFDQNTFASRGFLDETRALLRYAQKSAVAQRRTVCVALGANGVALTIASAAGSAVCDTPLILPAQPHGGQGLAASVAGFNFLAQGGTTLAADLNVMVGDASGAVTVDRVTGLVR